MKTFLFKNIKTQKILTYDEVKEMYAKSIGPDTIVSDREMCLIMPSLMHGNNSIIEPVEDELLNWCNEYADFNNMDKAFDQPTKDKLIKRNYLGIIEGTRIGGNKLVVLEIISALTDTTAIPDNSKANEMKKKLKAIRVNRSWVANETK